MCERVCSLSIFFLSAPGSFQTPDAETLSPELRDEDADVAFREETLGNSLSPPSHRAEDKKHNNNNNMLTCKRKCPPTAADPQQNARLCVYTQNLLSTDLDLKSTFHRSLQI